MADPDSFREESTAYFAFWFKMDLFNSSLPYKMRKNEAVTSQM